MKTNVMMMLHGVGNPDRNQYADIGPVLVVVAKSEDFHEEFKEALLWYTREHDVGGGNCGWDHGMVMELTDDGVRYLGRISYNGSWHAPSPIGEDPRKPPRGEVLKTLASIAEATTRDFDEYRKKREDEYDAFLAEVEAFDG